MVISLGSGIARRPTPDVGFPLETVVGRDQVQRAKEAVRECIDNGLGAIDLDFDSVLGVSSDLINFLLWCQMECSRNNVNLRVVHLTPAMMKAFRFAGLNQVLHLQGEA
jgi:anti-anti-sigma regulatory factor